MKYIYPLFLSFVFCTSSEGQNKPDLPTNNIKSEAKDVITSYGPNSITRTIKQDRNGNIWIASWEGIFRYDGKAFTNITSKVSSARFFSVLEDRKGNFWFGSVGSGVYYYDGKSFRNFTTKEGLVNDRVTDIYEDKIGNIWFGTEGGASCYDGKSFQNFLSYNEVYSIIEDKTGKFWFGTKGIACVYDGKTFTDFTHNGKSFTNVRTVIEDKKGNIWLGGKDGLWCYDGSTLTNFTQNFVGYVYGDENGNIWTSSANGSYERNWVLSRYEAKSLSDKKPTVIEIKPEVGGLFGISEDDEGNIWFGTGTGVYRYDGNSITDFKGNGNQK